MNYLAIDLGAESGRLILGQIDGEKVALEEIHRIPNKVNRSENQIAWDVRSLWRGIDAGLQLTGEKNSPITSLSADSWGVDYVLLCHPKEKRSSLGLTGPSEPAFHYRDPRAAVGTARIFEKLSWEKIFQETGIQYMPINTLFQLASEDTSPNGRIARAVRVLSHADYVNFLFSGVAAIEESMASTFQIYDPNIRDWSPVLLEALGLSRSLFGDVVPSGTLLGAFNDPRHWKRPSFRHTKVIATCSHDSGCAVAAVPANGTNWAYLSSGTWSLMGVELPPNNKSSIVNHRSSINSPSLNPIINEKSRTLNFTNEIGYNSTIRLLKNISGLWLLQECRRAWAEAGQSYDYAELTRLAAAEQNPSSLIDPMDPRFLAPSNMPEAIASFCREQNQSIPKSPGQFTRCIFESLAQLYAKTLHQLEDLTGQNIERLHIVGGGSKNALLNQLTANACRIPVLAGPVEATALGNIIIQAITAGEIPDLPTARSLIAKNFEPRTFLPQ